jgi:hypothetical protein
MSQQQRVSALFPHHNTAFSRRFYRAAPAKSLSHHSGIHRAAYFTSSAYIRVGVRVLLGKFFTTRLWGVHLASLEVRFWRVGRGSQASLPARSKHTQHTLPTSHNTHLGAPPHSPSPPPFPVHIAAGPLPRPLNYHTSRAPRVRRDLPRHVTVTVAAASRERVRPASIREHHPWFCLTSTTASDAPVLSASASCARAFTRSTGPLLTRQTVYQNKPFIRHYTLQIYSSTWIPL